VSDVKPPLLSGEPIAAAVAFLLSGAALVFPMAALPALLATLLAVIMCSGRLRAVIALVCGLASTVATVVFIRDVMMPNLVSSGRKATEDKGLSRLREVAWAERLAIQSALVDADGDGRGESARIEELAGHDRSRWNGAEADAVLKSSLYQPAGASEGVKVHRVEGYLVVAWPGRGAAGADAAESGWEAYAWPSEDAAGTRRSFFVDDSDRICETVGVPIYSGSGVIPRPGAATRGGPGEGCGTGRDGAQWRPWKRKTARETAQDRGDAG